MQPLKDQSYRIPFTQPDIWLKHLEAKGFVVIANYLSKEECDNRVQQFWDIMEQLSLGRLDRKDVETQTLSKSYPPVLHGGMIQYVAHSQTQWDLRKLSKPIFQRIWGTNDLKSSFDGFCFMNGKRNYQPRSNDAFLHCDQSPKRNEVWSYQGVQTLTDSGIDQGGFVCVPESHLYHHEYFESKKLLDHKEDWYLVPEDDKPCQPFKFHIKLNTKAGDFILWDSRTFHCNTVPTDKNALRICSYICMLPSSHIDEKIMEKRKDGVDKRRVSNHHPGNGFKLFPSLPRYIDNSTKDEFKKALDNVNDFKLDKEIEALI